MYTVYCHRNKINGKVYIGLTSKKVETRWRNGRGYESSPHFWSAIQQYGWDSFEHIILAENLTSQEASEQEKYYIELYNSTDPNYGYNLREGGLNNFKPCEKTLKKAIEATHQKKGTYGKKVRCLNTNDVFQSAAEAERWCGSCKVIECCQKKRNYAGTNPETGERLQWEYAEDSAEVTIHCLEKITQRAPRKNTPVICVNTGVEFPSYKEAAKWANLKDTANIIRCTNGERQSAGRHPETGEKLKWKKVEKGDIN